MAMAHKVFFLGIAFCFYSAAFAQELPQAKNTSASSQEILTKSIEKAVKKAIKDADKEKAKEQEAIAEELEKKLVTAVNGWVLTASDDKTQQLNKLQHRDWIELEKFVSPLPYDYYLRSFAYAILKSDVIKTDSVVAPYKAFVEIEERLYLERYHSPDAAYPEDYRYTAITPIDLLLEYRSGEFAITETKYGQVTIESGWPK